LFREDNSPISQQPSRFNIAFENLQTILVLAGELAQTNRVWFFALTLNGSLASRAGKPRPNRENWVRNLNRRAIKKEVVGIGGVSFYVLPGLLFRRE